MEPIIKNMVELLSDGDLESRRIVLELTKKTLAQLNACERIKSIIHREGSILRIGERQWDLAQKRHVYLIGAGKACNAMAMAVEQVLGKYLTDGIAIVKISEDTDRFEKTRVFVGGHPIPNEAGLRASEEVLRMIDGACSEDLFICVMSGGSSALMSAPVEGLTLDDEIRTTDVLLKSGANIREINAIRRHISRMNGGRMAQRIAQKGAELIGFNISDSVSNGPTGDISVPWQNYQGTPMGPDYTTIADALSVIRNYDLKARLPARVVEYLEHCTAKDETPKAFPQNTYYQINTLPDSCVYAQEAARQMGIPSLVLTTYLEGEATEAGKFMASIARQIQNYGQPIHPPCVVLSAGEVVTTISDNNSIHGHGGPSQEMVLGFAEQAVGAPGACLLSIDSEGTDGTTLAAGGITDSKTLPSIKMQGLDLYRALREHSSFEILHAVGSSVMTGNTGTNVCDINIMYVPEKGQ